MSAPTVRTGVVVVAQNDGETIEPSLRSYYPWVDRVVLSTDPARGWTGVPITPDDTVARVRAADPAGKLEVVAGDFCRAADPAVNETVQRQEAADRVAAAVPGIGWVLQVDADEEFLDFPGVLARLARLPARTRAVWWWWINVYNYTPDGRYLVVTDPAGRPMLETFPLGHRPHVRLQSLRQPEQPVRSPLLRRLLGHEFRPPVRPLGQAVLHLSYAKSEARIREKLATYAHAGQVDPDRLLATWRAARTDWAGVRDFHPVIPARWPALRAFTRDELLGYDGPLAEPYRSR